MGLYKLEQCSIGIFNIGKSACRLTPVAVFENFFGGSVGALKQFDTAVSEHPSTSR